MGQWLQPVVWLLPTSHVFEGMRAVLFDRHFDTGMFLSAVALNVVYLITGAAVFLRAFEHARERGLLLQAGE